MNVAAIALLGVTALIGTVLWYVVDRRRDEISARAAVLAAVAPALLLGVAGLLALSGPAGQTGINGTASAVAVVAAVPGGSLLATAILRLADRTPRSRDADEEAPSPQDGASSQAPPSSVSAIGLVSPAWALSAVSNPETLRGGATIGALERVAVVVTLLAGWPEGLALTLALKGFGRYPELRKPSAPERFIIGTFASILWAVAVAGVVVAIRA